MEWGNIILVAVSGLVGVGGTLLGAILNNHFGRQQMKEAWAEEERRRKSDRRREIYERELRIVRDSVKAMRKAMGGLVWGDRKELLAGLIRKAFLMQATAYLVTASLEDEELRDSYDELTDGYYRWLQLVKTDSGKAKKGKEDQYDEATEQTNRAAVKVWRRTEELLEEA